MARLDLGGLRDLWYRIDDIFARISEALGSISFSGTTLSWNHVNGSSAGSADLGATFATRNQAGSRLGISGRTITLYDVNGGSNGSVTVPETSTSGLMHTSTANDRFGHSLYLNGKKLSLVSYDGTILSTVTLP